LISVIIPTFNRRERLLQAVASVRRQSFRDWELLVVDDGSTDGTREAVKALGCARIRCLVQPHGGVSGARNRGIRAARHDWIAFLDSDDEWRPTKLQRQIEALEDHPEYRAVHTDEIWIRSGKRVNPRKHHRKRCGWMFNYCLRLCLISPSSILLHRQLLNELGLFDEEFPVCEDYELWLRLTSRRPVLLVPEKLIVKRGGHPDQLSRSRWGLDRYRVQALLKAVDSGTLTPQQLRWTAAEIVRKSAILEGGCSRRGKTNRAAYYRELGRRFQEPPSSPPRPPAL
jgi:glycosyltransferase involved in cell wall biosynthesis